ncbi:MAG: acetyl-CoA carboxylase carboxyl transferase subunit beta [Rhodobiaceae bacterium]|nr:acetyl-CoA carboxylase carboxyl transferase subunit beta [Rhodobiaceae bacterium]
MNWFKKIVPPGLKKIFSKRSSTKDLWLKCNSCEAMLFHKDAKENLYVCNECDNHMRISAKERFNQLLDQGSIKYIEDPIVPIDPLKFRDERKYIDRLKDSKKKTKIADSVVIGYGSINKINVTMAVHDFQFMGGSLGMAAGESIIKAIKHSLDNHYPFILCASSGGARMQEGILSLMQMPRTTIMIQALREKRIPYIVLLTNPTTGGVTASYAMLGDIHIAEPNALIGFAGPRVIENTIKENLPDGFQKSEYLLDHGMIDMVSHRKDLKNNITSILDILMKSEIQKSANL